MELTKAIYKGFHIDIAQNDSYENYIIYLPLKGKYLENSPIFYTIQQVKEYIANNESELKND